MLRVLFVCTGNTCRSPMAAGALREHARRAGPEAVRLGLGSAGTTAVEGRPASGLAVEACAEYGIDIRGHRSRTLSRELLAESDLVLVMEQAHRREVLRLDPQAGSRVHLFGEFAQGEGACEIADPIGGSLDDYRRTLRHLIGLAEQAWKKMVAGFPGPDVG